MFKFKDKRKAAIGEVVDKARKSVLHVEISRQQPSRGTFDMVATVRSQHAIIPTEIGKVEIAFSGFTLEFEVLGGQFQINSLGDILHPAARSPTTVSQMTSTVAGQHQVTRRNSSFGGGADTTGARGEGSISRDGEQGQTSSSTVDEEVATERTLWSLIPVDGSALRLQFDGSNVGLNTLQGTFYSDRAATVSYDEGEDSCRLMCSVDLMPRNVKVVDGSGVWASSLSDNQQKLINRLTAKLIDEAWYVASVEFDDKT